MACARVGEDKVGAVAAEGAAQGVRTVRRREMMGMREAEEDRGHWAKVRLQWEWGVGVSVNEGKRQRERERERERERKRERER